MIISISRNPFPNTSPKRCFCNPKKTHQRHVKKRESHQISTLSGTQKTSPLSLGGPGGNGKGNLSPLLGLGVKAALLGELPLGLNLLASGLAARGDLGLILLRHANEALGELLLVRDDGLAIRADLGLDVEAPENTRDTKE